MKQNVGYFIIFHNYINFVFFTCMFMLFVLLFVNEQRT